MASESNRDLKNNSTGSGFNISTLIVEYPVQDLISNSLLNDEIFLMTLKKNISCNYLKWLSQSLRGRMNAVQ